MSELSGWDLYEYRADREIAVVGLPTESAIGCSTGRKLFDAVVGKPCDRFSYADS